MMLLLVVFDISRNNTTQRRTYWEENFAEKLLRVLPTTGGNSRPTGGAGPAKGKAGSTPI
jgi:hypothetical protein